MGYDWYKTELYDEATAVTSITTTVKTGGTDADVQYMLEIEPDDDNNRPGTLYYWDTTWKKSDGTWAQSTAKSDFNANLSTAPIKQPYGSFKVVAIIDDTNGTKLDEFVVDYSKYSEINPRGTRVIVRVRKAGDGASGGVLVKAQLTDVSTDNIEYQGTYFNPTSVEVNTDDNGVAVLELAPNEKIEPANSHWQITIGSLSAQKYTIPKDVAEVELSDLTPA